MLQPLLNRIRRDANLVDLLRNSSVIYAGGLISLVLTFVQQISTANLLGSADYGRLNVVLSSGLLILLFMDFRTWEAGSKLLARTTQTDEQHESIRVISWLLVVEVVTGVIGVVLLMALASPIATYLLRAPELDQFVRLYALSLPFRIVASGVTGALPRFFNHFDWITYKSIGYAALRLLLMTGAAWLGLGVVGVLIGAALGEVANALILLVMAWVIRRRHLARAPLFDLVRPREFVAGRRLLRDLWVSATLVGVHQYAFIPALALFTSPAQVGLFRSGLDVAELLEKIVQPFTIVITPKILTLYEAGLRAPFVRYLKQCALLLAAVTVPLVAGMLLFGPLLFPRLLGADFAGIAPIASMLVIGYGINFVITSWTRPALIAMGVIGAQNVIMLVQSVVLLMALVALAPSYGALGGAWVKGGVTGVFPFAYLALVVYSLRRAMRSPPPEAIESAAV